MSTVTPAVPAPPADAPAAAKEISRPYLWLLVIVVAALALRLYWARSPVQTEEFVALAAVAERPGTGADDRADGYTATADSPLAPVGSLDEVRRRSVIPYGIPDPVPAYNYLLYAVAKTLPISAWTMRLPSLLAGLGCVVAVFFLARRLLGTEVALVAALFVAVDPLQVAVSWVARPYALANLACLGSFAALWGVLRARTPGRGALLAAGYAACVAAIGYLSPVLLLVVAAHLGMVGYALATKSEGAGWKAGCVLAGLVVGVALLAPEFSYYQRVYDFSRAHSDYLVGPEGVAQNRVLTLLWHNLAFLGGLLLVLAAGAIVRLQLQGGGDATAPEAGGEGGPTQPANGAAPADGSTTAVTAAAPAGTAVAPATAPAQAEPAPAPELAGEPLPENEDGTWMSRLWIFLPQLAAVVLGMSLAVPVFATRYLTYTTLGAAILLAYYATRDRSREVRLGVAGFVALALLAFGFWNTWSLGDGRLFSSDFGEGIVSGLASKDMAWVDGDALLVRAGLPDADFLRTDVPEEARPHVTRALLAPLTMLYTDKARKPLVLTSYSEYRNDKVWTPGGGKAPLPEFYGDEFGRRVKKFDRYRLTGLAPTPTPAWPPYMAGLVPRLADIRQQELLLARNRGEKGSPTYEADHYIRVKPGLNPSEDIDGLTKDVLEKDFLNVIPLLRPIKAGE